MFPSELRRDDGRYRLVAAADLAAEVVVARYDGPVVPLAAVPAADRARALARGEDRWLIPAGPAYHLDLADDPNCDISDNLAVVTLRPVGGGEALTVRPPAPAAPSVEAHPAQAAFPDLEVRPVPGKGRGVFARRRFAPGELVERAPVLVVPAVDWVYVAGTVLSRYCFRFGPAPLDAAVALGCGSLYNHSYRPNAFYLRRLEAEAIDFVALRGIEPGEEVTINYDGTPEGQGAVWFEVAE
jgi:hypothetical protein